MSFRTKQIYLTSRTYHRLHLLCNVMAAEKLTPVTSDTPKVSPDELADSIINQTIDRLYPQISELEKAIAKLEKDCAAQLKGKEADAA